MNLPSLFCIFPTEHPRSPITRIVGNPKRGEYITGISRSKRVLEFFCLSLKTARRSFRGSKEICIVSKLHLTNFFDLSNIRFESGGPVKMFGASRCLRNVLFQFEGHPALRADSPFPCDSSTHLLFKFLFSFKRIHDQTKSFPSFKASVVFPLTQSAELHSICGLSK